MKRLKNPTKKILGISLFSLCFFSFIASAHAIDIPAQTYDLEKGTVVAGTYFEYTFSYSEGETFDIRFKRSGWFVFRFQLDIEFDMMNGKYDQIKVYFDMSDYVSYVYVHAYYTDSTKDTFTEWYDGMHTYNVDDSKNLDYIRIKYDQYSTAWPHRFIYIDYIAGVSFF